KSTLRVRLGQQDAHYGGNLVDGARILALFGDVATEILIRRDGDEGLFRAYDSVEFLAPVHAGDFIEVYVELYEAGATSRKIPFRGKEGDRARPGSLGFSCGSAATAGRGVPGERNLRGNQRQAEAALMSQPPMVITAAMVGAETTREQTPYLPIY